MYSGGFNVVHTQMFSAAIIQRSTNRSIPVHGHLQKSQLLNRLDLGRWLKATWIQCTMLLMVTAEQCHAGTEQAVLGSIEVIPIKPRHNVEVKSEQETVNDVIDIGVQILMVRADVVEGQIIDNRGTIQITSTFGDHEMGELKDSGMEINDLSHGVLPISKNLVNDMLICSSDYEGLIENSQLVRNPAIL
ncbi:hypothetical protein TNCV_3675901 [Trichonephila clavipes]|nr:hypothetical protein TNCV_3675901 [Trichonephila clavipes]